MYLPMLFIATLLFALVAFSVGFIINMIVRIWWASIAAALIFIVVQVFNGGEISAQVFEHGAFRWFDWMLYIVFPALFCILSALSYRSLRRRGYRLFQ